MSGISVKINTASMTKTIASLKSQGPFKKKCLKLIIAKYTLLIKADAKTNIRSDPRRIDEGTLWNTLDDIIIGLKAAVFSPEPYACVIGQTSVTTEQGSKNASAIRVGDKVLTQGGVYKPVAEVYRYIVPEGDEMVTIESLWRKDRNHKLKLTPDHKILIYRNGRNKWVPACEIVIDDEVFERIKIPHNKGRDSRPVRTCDNCGVKYQGQGKRFCTPACRDEAFADGGSPLIGRKRIAKERANMSIGQRRRLIEKPESHPSRIVSQRGFKTDIEKDVAEFLGRLKVSYEEQMNIGPFVVDFYCKEAKIIVEADGAFWHKDQEKDIERDQSLLDLLGDDWKIYHLHFYEARHSPLLNTAPIPNVYYVPMNPGTHSFVDPELFQRTPVINVCIEKQEYPRTVYDFRIEDIHSYFAGGALVSNSFVHWGTGIHGESPEGGHRRTPWIYFDEKRQEFFLTSGMEPNKFLQKAWRKYEAPLLKELKDCMRKSKKL